MHVGVVEPHKADTIALVSAGVGLLSLAPLPSPLRGAMLTVFVLTGPGLAVVTWMRLPRPAGIVALPVVGLSTMTLSTAIMGWLNMWVPVELWVPVPLLVTLVSGVVISALLHARAAGGFAPLLPLLP